MIWYLFTLGRDQPHPAFSGASRLQYHNSPSLTFFSCLCILIFSSPRLSFSPSFWFYAFLSFTASLWPEPYHCQSPWRWADRHPTLLLRQTERGGKERKRKMRERKDCVSVSSLSPPSGRMEIRFSLSWNTDVVPALMRKLYLRQMGPGRNNTGENLRGVSLCSRILTPNDEFKPKWAFP